MNLQPYLDFTTQLAYRAGRITLGYFNTGLRPDFKADDTPVTAADRATEQFIRGEIEKTYPGHAIIGEEFGENLPSPGSGRGAGASPEQNRRGEGENFRWIIDPIDGTKSFLHGVPLYGVLIGLEIEGEVRVGACYCPGTDEMLCAADGLGAWWNGRRAHVSELANLNRACACFTSYHGFDRVSRGPAWERLQKAVYMTRGWSDAYGYLLVATGRAEMMLDPVMALWDCGPFPPIFREAGGYFGSWDGRPGHTYNEAIACNAALLPELLALVRE